ncbi:MAG: hypothetical protein RR620_14150, partial [Clostridium sp.]
SVEIGEIFSYSIDLKNESECDIYNILYEEYFSKNVNVIGVELDSKRISYTLDEDNKISIEIDNIHPEEKKKIYITIEAIDFIEKNTFNDCGIIKGEIIKGSMVQNTKYLLESLNIYMLNPKLGLTLISSSNELVAEQIVRFNIKVENMGNTKLYDIAIRDILKNEFAFIEESVEIDNIQRVSENIISGVNIGDLNEGDAKTITFLARVVEEDGDIITVNKAIGRFKYKSLQENLFKNSISLSNENKMTIQSEKVKISIDVDTESISLNKPIEYVIKIMNVGTVDLCDLLLRDLLPKEFNIIDNSIQIDKKLIKHINLNSGVLLGNLQIGKYIIVKFKIKLSRGINKGYINNVLILDKDYRLSDKNVYNGKSIETYVKHMVNMTAFKQVIMDGEILLTEYNPPVGEINSLKCTVDIKNYYLIDTIEGTSVSGQNLTGKKLIVNGVIKANLEYTVKDEQQSVHFISNNQMFSTFIVLSDQIASYDKIVVKGEIENTDYNIINEQRIDTIVSLLVVAKILIT